MSYILDALKRSEQERHQDKMPSFSAENMIIQSNQKKTHWWPYVLILVLILNALGLFFYSSGTLKITAPQTEELDPPALDTLGQTAVIVPDKAQKITKESPRRAPPSSVVKDRQYIKPLKQKPKLVLQSEWQHSTNIEGSRADDHLYGTNVDEGLLIKPSLKPKTFPTQNSKSQEFGVAEQIERTNTPVQNKTTMQNEQVESKQFDEPVNQSNAALDQFSATPLLTNLDGSFQRSIPALTFNSHIYSDKPSQRRVMINNYYLKEGQSFDGLQLVEIGEAFIKVNKEGTVFKLPVLRDWDSQ